MTDEDRLFAASSLVDALSAIAKAEDAIHTALACIGATSSAPPDRKSVATRTTGTQILAVLAASQDPLTLIDIADGVVSIRRGEDTPRKNGGTRYQELCRAALQRLIDRRLVERVEPVGKTDLMRFRRRTMHRGELQ